MALAGIPPLNARRCCRAAGQVVGAAGLQQDPTSVQMLCRDRVLLGSMIAIMLAAQVVQDHPANSVDERGTGGEGEGGEHMCLAPCVI